MSYYFDLKPFLVESTAGIDINNLLTSPCSNAGVVTISTMGTKLISDDGGVFHHYLLFPWRILPFLLPNEQTFRSHFHIRLRPICIILI